MSKAACAADPACIEGSAVYTKTAICYAYSLLGATDRQASKRAPASRHARLYIVSEHSAARAVQDLSRTGRGSQRDIGRTVTGAEQAVTHARLEETLHQASVFRRGKFKAPAPTQKARLCVNV